jgi:hypothetical protein
MRPKGLFGRRGDAGLEAFPAQGAFCLVGAEDVVTGVSDDHEIQGRCVFSGSASVFVEGHVQRPVKALDAPMNARCGEFRAAHDRFLASSALYFF